ncbi:hypothetical protein NKJ71_25565 [Mesorhizobium sp. M0050]|uniref:hypothetical protein n=1 Tax=Mesorhizobium sp. M0050 TaxID=2956861 RepID=UPI0033376BAD
MTAYFPSSLMPTAGETKANRQANRRELRNRMREHGKAVVEANGYKVGEALGLERGRAYHAKRNGKSLKIGFRAGADRWIAATSSALDAGGELTEVDEIFVVTFKDPKVRDAIEVYRFKTSVIVDAANKVFAASGKTGQQWIPLDDAKDMGVHSMAGGSLGKHGEVISTVDVVWKDGDVGGADVTAPLKLTLDQAKAGLAAQFGVSKDAIHITIEG